MARLSSGMVLIFILGATAVADQPAAPPLGTLGDGTPPTSLAESLVKGKVSLNVRARYEYADSDGSAHSHAETLRTRLGYGTAPYRGLSFFAEMEDIRALDDDSYDPNRIETIPPRTFISDPEVTELNQAYVRYDSEILGFGVVAGRQRIVLDDHRFIGNVGWRQNEQTYDAIKVTSDFDTEHWLLTYAWLWEVNRIFGDEAQAGLMPAGSATRDFESDSHLINLAYDGLAVGRITGFAYLLDLERKGDGLESASSHTFGLRLDGQQPINDDVSLGYILSYAHQTDAAGNPASYDADYYLAEGAIILKHIGRFSVGYELLGADGTANGFRTPLATLHAFQGWSDVLLGPSLTGSPLGAGAGIRDVYLAFSPAELPWELNGQVVYHFFDTDTGDVDIGEELNLLLSRRINAHLTVLAKYADYNARDFGADTRRFWLELTFAF